MIQKSLFEIDKRNEMEVRARLAAGGQAYFNFSGLKQRSLSKQFNIRTDSSRVNSSRIPYGSETTTSRKTTARFITLRGTSLINDPSHIYNI